MIGLKKILKLLEPIWHTAIPILGDLQGPLKAIVGYSRNVLWLGITRIGDAAFELHAAHQAFKTACQTKIIFRLLIIQAD